MTSSAFSSPPSDEAWRAVPRHWRPRVESKWAIGVDLAQSVDATALAVCERWCEWRADMSRPGQRERNAAKVQRLRPAAPQYRVHGLVRLEVGLPYTEQAERIHQLLATPELGNASLIVDMTGVGAPVVDLLRASGLSPIGVTITAGAQSTRHGRSWHVAKLTLIATLQAKFHDGSLKIHDEAPHAKTLMAELADFRFHHTAQGSITWGARAGRHDDLLLALSLAVWHLSRGASMTKHGMTGI